MILYVDKETKYCSVVTLSNDISEEYYFEKYCDENYIKIEDDKVPNSRFLKYENGKVLEDTKRINEILYIQTKSKAIDILKKTDFLLICDNPLNLSENELNQVKLFRKQLREINQDNFKNIIKTPEFLKKTIGE